MKQYDVKCPVCKKLNKGLYLQETGGFMECDGCGTAMRVMQTENNRFIPFLTPEVCESIIAHAG